MAPIFQKKPNPASKKGGGGLEANSWRGEMYAVVHNCAVAHIHFHLSNFYGRPQRTEKKVTISRQDGGREKGNISQGNGGCLKVSDWEDGEGWRGTLAESNCNKGGGGGRGGREEEEEDEINPLLLGTGKEGHGRRRERAEKTKRAERGTGEKHESLFLPLSPSLLPA